MPLNLRPFIISLSPVVRKVFFSMIAAGDSVGVMEGSKVVHALKIYK